MVSDEMADSLITEIRLPKEYKQDESFSLIGCEASPPFLPFCGLTKDAHGRLSTLIDMYASLQPLTISPLLNSEGVANDLEGLGILSPESVSCRARILSLVPLSSVKKLAEHPVYNSDDSQDGEYQVNTFAPAHVKAMDYLSLLEKISKQHQEDSDGYKIKLPLKPSLNL